MATSPGAVFGSPSTSIRKPSTDVKFGHRSCASTSPACSHRWCSCRVRGLVLIAARSQGRVGALSYARFDGAKKSNRGSHLSASTAAAAGVASRYATALFELARDQDCLDDIANDLVGLEALIAESPDFAELVSSPVVSRTAQGEAVKKIATQAGLSDLTTNLVGVLASQRRLKVIADVSHAYRDRVADHRGEIKAEVISAAPLDDEQLKAITTSVGQFAGRAVQVETAVDEGLLGGLVVRIGSHMLDASLRTKLNKLEQSMRGLG